ncbi:hypothetical protein GBA52_010102 [Prunus armeniaca]|nr:hypothetical protein GBA52_010102 [Prunus armeniaca]
MDRQPSPTGYPKSWAPKSMSSSNKARQIRLKFQIVKFPAAAIGAAAKTTLPKKPGGRGRSSLDLPSRATCSLVS